MYDSVLAHNYNFSYFGDNDNEEENTELNENEESESREIRTNRNGFPVRGKDLDWKNRRTFQDTDSFNSATDFQDELKEKFSCRKRMEYEYGDAHIYMCKVNRRKGYKKCPKQMRIIFHSDSLQVTIQETGVHQHIQEGNDLQVYKWSIEAERVIEISIKANATPTVTMRNLREQEIFPAGEEPPMSALKNKIAYMRKVLKISENLYTTQDLRTKLSEFTGWFLVLKQRKISKRLQQSDYQRDLK